MTSEEFRTNETLSKAWREMLEGDEILVMALGVAEEESPLNQDPDTATETNALVAYGFTHGYASCLRKLRDLANPTHKQPFIPTTYGVKPKNA